MNIVYVKVNEIIPYDKNPRKISETAIEKVAESIKAYGFKVPCIITKENVLVTGHTRILAAKKLKIEDIPCIVADDLNEKQIKAFRLADNKVSEFSVWDFDVLKDELADIDIDMSDFGFDMSFFDGTETHEKQYENTSKEINTDDYQDEHFNHECPRCKFRFND